MLEQLFNQKREAFAFPSIDFSKFENDLNSFGDSVN